MYHAAALAREVNGLDNSLSSIDNIATNSDTIISLLINKNSELSLRLKSGDILSYIEILFEQKIIYDDN